jgi:acyl dehydratase
MEPGQELPIIVTAPLTAADFAQYAAASGDHNPLHLNPNVAHAAGQPTVIAHGMLVMGLLGQVATAGFSPGALCEFLARFVAPTLPGETLHCGGQISTVTGNRVTAELWARNTDGNIKATATIVAEVQQATL